MTKGSAHYPLNDKRRRQSTEVAPSKPNPMETAMNKSILTVLAAATALVAAGTSFSPTTAQAGGIRLGFGVPLGAFVAHSMAEDSYRRERAYERRERSYSAVRAEREARAAASARERAARRAAKVRATELARAEARADNAKAEAKSELAKLNKAKDDTVQETASVTPAAEASKEKVAAVSPATTEVKEVKTAATSTAENTTSEPVEDTSKTEPKSTGKRDCKKFIPAVGVTISVGC